MDSGCLILSKGGVVPMDRGRVSATVKVVPKNIMEVPIWEKSNLTLDEAEVYSGIGKDKLRKITNEQNCKFVLWNGSKRLIKRKLFDEYIEKCFSI